MAVRRFSALLLVGIALLLLGVAQSPTDAQPRQHLRISDTNSDLQSLDPQFGGTLSGEPPLLSMIYEGLVRLKPGSTSVDDLQPALAERWAASQDRRSWTFFLRQGVKFHKGFGELTSDDVKYSLERNLTRTSPWRNNYLNVESVEAPRRHIVRITLKQPDPFFFLSVADYRGGFIVSKAAVEKAGDQYKLNPVGTGPFEFVQYVPRDRVELKRNDGYWRGRPALDRVTWLYIGDVSTRELAFRRRAIDMAVAPASNDWISGIRQAGGVAYPLGPGVPYYVHLNMTRQPLNDVRIRRALQHATNPEEFRQVVGRDITAPLFSPVPPGYFGQTDDVPKYPYDQNRAKALLAEAGRPNGFTTKSISSELPGFRVVMTLLQEQWRRVGVNLEVEYVDHASFHRLIRQDRSDVIFYSFTRAPLADVVLSEFFHSSATVGAPAAITNFTHYSAVDAEIEQARINRNQAEQRRLYAAIQRKIMEDAVVIPLVNTLWVIVGRPNVELPELTGVEKPASLNYFVPVTERTRLK